MIYKSYSEEQRNKNPGKANMTLISAFLIRATETSYI